MILRRRGVLAVVIAAAAVLAVAAGLRAAHTHRLDQDCSNNLGRIYTALTAFSEANGSFPELPFFPDDPVADVDSLLNVLREFGVTETDLVCPATDPTLQATGNTYVWNTRLSSKAWSDIEAAQWMLVEINAMSSRVPAPHRNHYHVLYTDGEVRSEKTPPAIL